MVREHKEFGHRWSRSNKWYAGNNEYRSEHFMSRAETQQSRAM